MHGGGLELALVFLLAAVIAVPVFKRFGLGAVLGYLAAGVMLGPYALKVVPNPEPVLTASEIGVVMMLFVIGLELSLPRLKLMRKPIFGVGGLQVLLSAVALGAVAYFFYEAQWRAAIIIGAALALSSTAVGLQLLAERKELNEEHGRLAFAILLFQDLAAIPLLASIPLLGGVTASDGEAQGLAVAKAVGAIALLVVGGRLLLRQLFSRIARLDMPEVFTATALLVVLGSAWLMQLVGLSAGLGAFIAGVILADSEFRHELESQIQPFEGLLLGLFFMAVGMTIDLRFVVDQPRVMIIGVLVLMVTKFAILFALGKGPGKLDTRGALLMGGVLALGGEFAFVVFSEADRAGLIDTERRNLLTAVVGLSMALTPLVLLAINALVKKPKAAAPTRAFDEIPDDHPQVMIAGFGRFGQIVARLLFAQKIRFVAIDADVEQVDFFRKFGSPIYYGDPSKPDLLRSAGADKIKVFVVAVGDQKATLRIVRLLRRRYPNARVIARARDREHAWQLMDFSVTPVRETFASALETGCEVLQELGMSEATARSSVDIFRQHDERMLQAQHLIYDDEDALRQSAQDSRAELEQLFAAQIGEGEIAEVLRETEGQLPAPR